MRWLILFCAMTTAGLLSRHVPSQASPRGPQSRLQDAFEILGSVPSGRALLDHAKKQWALKNDSQLLSFFRWSSVSKTDAVLTRHFNPVTGKERRERKVTIYLRQKQKLEDLVLDVAHELTHATGGPSWDPYDAELTPGKYVWASIEGAGGEVDALQFECQAGFELKVSLGISVDRCGRYQTGEQIDREKIRRDFYLVGKWQPELFERLGDERKLFPLLSGGEPQLFSSTGHAPYPVALLQEYDEITRIACENSRKRLDQLPQNRSLASLFGLKQKQAPSGAASRFLALRCN